MDLAPYLYYYILTRCFTTQYYILNLIILGPKPDVEEDMIWVILILFGEEYRRGYGGGNYGTTCGTMEPTYKPCVCHSKWKQKHGRRREEPWQMTSRAGNGRKNEKRG